MHFHRSDAAKEGLLEAGDELELIVVQIVAPCVE